MRLDKYVSDAMQVSRTDAKKLIVTGKVLVNGQICRKGETQVQSQDSVSVAGQEAVQREEFVYIMLNKPLGVVSASTDKRDTTVTDLVKDSFPRRTLFPAGRLDKTSTGFILLTDDGTFAHAILSPKRHIEKEYLVTLDTPFTQQMQEGFAKGVTLVDGTVLAPAQAFATDNPFEARVILTQGVYHQIKRMFGIYNAGVNQLHRLRMGGLILDQNLDAGQWRKLTLQEKDLIAKR